MARNIKIKKRNTGGAEADKLAQKLIISTRWRCQMSKTLKVSSMGNASDARRVGVKVGDIVLSYNGMLISTNAELLRAISITNEIGVICADMLISRRGRAFKFELILDSKDMCCTEISKELPLPGRVVSHSQASDNVASFVSFLS